MTIMKWCCPAFEGWYEAAGERGFAILVERDSAGKPEFILQHLAFDREVESLPETEFPMSVVSEVRIGYCPWCGRQLDKWYGKYVDDLYRAGLKIIDP